MKLLLRGIIFTFLAISLSQKLVHTFSFSDDKVFWMILFAIALMNVFKRTMLDLVSLPARGPVFQLLSAFLTGLLLSVMAAIVPGFEFVATQTASFNILGFMIPSTYLTPLWSAVVAAVTISLISDFFYWLSRGKKEK